MERDEIHAMRNQLQVMMGAWETKDRTLYFAAVRKLQLLLDLAQARAEASEVLKERAMERIRSLSGKDV